MKFVSRASHLGFTVGFLRFDGPCTAQRFHTEGEEQTCRVGCLDELDSGLLLSLQRMSLIEKFYVPLCGDMSWHHHGEVIFSMT